ncbi:PTS galactosamine/N-acetylgalactosamine transporter subunit IIA [Photorhabdus cinerea]|uniref:PTS N-acetylgalactosamine transporter subunit IIA n=1 Tax=Photorhabdus cinerea TaxID=471575 RepID=A0A7X5QHQ5_9GAMM|nr:PTS galactosamine/N-acetylgalactosamine transporter subunit IIA [Photorhabdus cinerea]NHB94574.1 PTS N-acetylgalactosamine transporter subunit IIA [Photorhabdus cinerea]
MLGIVITGHGRFASGLLQAVEQIVGQQPQCCAVDFPEGVSTEQLLVLLEEACIACDSGDGVIILSDLLGGSPFRQAAQLAITNPHYEVITGTNMQLAVEMMLDREGLVPKVFRDMALECGRRGLTSLWHEQQKQGYSSPNLDGI